MPDYVSLKNFIKSLPPEYQKTAKKLSPEQLVALNISMQKNEGKLPNWFMSLAATKNSKAEGNIFSQLSYQKDETLQKDINFRVFDYNVETDRAIKKQLLENAQQDLPDSKNLQRVEYFEGGRIKRKVLSDPATDKPIRIMNFDEYGDLSAVEKYSNDTCELTEYKGAGKTVATLMNSGKTVKYYEKEFLNNTLLKEKLYDPVSSQMIEQKIYNDEGTPLLTEKYAYNIDGSYTQVVSSILSAQEQKMYLQKNVPTSTKSTYNSENKKVKVEEYCGESLKRTLLYSNGSLEKVTNYDSEGKIKSSDVYNHKTGGFDHLDAEGNIINNDMQDNDSMDVQVTSFKPDYIPSIENEKKNINDIKNIIMEDDEEKRNAGIDKLINDLNNPEMAKQLACQHYETAPKRADNGIKVMCLALEACKTGDKIFRKQACDVLRNVMKNSDAYMELSFADFPNGKIDKPHYQGSMGDCWLLETINALSRTDKGQELIEDCIKVNKKDGSVEVTLGQDKLKYRISAEELTSSINLSQGDADVRAIEIAFEKYFNDYRPGDKEDIWGNWTHTAMSILTGNQTKKVVNKDGKLGLDSTDGFIEINKKNKNKLKRIPLQIPATIENLELLKQFKPDIVICIGLNSHEYSLIHEKDGFITTTEPHNSENQKKFTSGEILRNMSNKNFDVMIL